MGVKKYFKRQFQLSNFGLEHDAAPDFYLGSWQRNRSCVPLLCLRGILCTGNIAMVIASMVLLASALNGYGFWWIYLTHWGIVANAVTSLFAFGISLRVYINGPLDSSYGLPWYIKVYWFLFNACTPVAFLISIFYWAFLSGLVEVEDMDPTLDVFVHGVNSVMMLTLLVTSRHPSRLFHFFHCITFNIIYLTFTLIYYYSGGLDSNGNVWIYPMMDWSNPGPTAVVVVAVAIGLIALHGLVVLIALSRDYFSRRLRKESSFSISE